jgi:hypothetical protein
MPVVNRFAGTVHAAARPVRDVRDRGRAGRLRRNRHADRRSDGCSAVALGSLLVGSLLVGPLADAVGPGTVAVAGPPVSPNRAGVTAEGLDDTETAGLESDEKSPASWSYLHRQHAARNRKGEST